MKPLRILIGTLDIGNNIRLFAQGFRELGFDVTTTTLRTKGVLYDDQYDVDVRPLHAAAMEAISRGQYPDTLMDDPRWADLFDHDVYFFVASHTLLPGLLDLPLLKQRGKLLLSYQAGSEVRFWQMAQTFNAAYGHGFPQGLVSPYINGAEEIAAFAGFSRYLDVFANKLHNIRMAERYSAAVYSQPCSNVLGLRPYFAALLPLDTSRCKPRIPGRDHPVIVHAPTNAEFKRSDLIISTLEQLWKEGHAFELRLIRNLPNARLLETLTDADVLIDQIACGKSGLLGFEGMASGCAVLGCNDEDAAPVPANAIPVVRIAPDNLYEVLKKTVTDKAFRIAQAEAGLRYVEAGLHTPKNIARYVVECVDRAHAGDYDYYPTQLVERPEFPEGERIPEYLKDMSVEILANHGAPPGFAQSAMVKAGLLPDDALPHLGELETWDVRRARRQFWGYTGPNAIWPRPIPQPGA